MSLLDTLRLGVDLADKITKDLQSLVGYERRLSSDGYGKHTYASKVQLHAVVDFTARQVRTQEGVLSVSRATITLLDIDEVVAATAGQGIGNDDRFTFPDGDTGPILDISGFIDPGTGHPIASTVIIG